MSALFAKSRRPFWAFLDISDVILLFISKQITSFWSLLLLQQVISPQLMRKGHADSHSRRPRWTNQSYHMRIWTFLHLLSPSFFTCASSVGKWNLRAQYLGALGILLVFCWAHHQDDRENTSYPTIFTHLLSILLSSTVWWCAGSKKMGSSFQAHLGEWLYPKRGCCISPAFAAFLENESLVSTAVTCRGQATPCPNRPPMLPVWG